MASLFGTGKAKQPPETALRVTTSLQGRPLAVVYGQTRLGGNLIDYGGFYYTNAKASGGKGGLAGGGGKGNSGSYNYFVSALVSLGHQNAGIISIINGSAIDYLVAPTPADLTKLAALNIVPSVGNTYGMIWHAGNGTQTPDPQWSSSFGARALAYRNQSYLVFPNLGLGSSPSFPNFNFEVLGAINSDLPALGPDANPADVIADILTNSVYGIAGFGAPGAGITGASLLGDFNTARNYWRATGMLISMAYTSQASANTVLADLLKALNAEFRWSNGKLDIVPYGDVAVSGNGYTYTPNLTPVYDIGIDDLLPNVGSLGASGSGGTTAVGVSRSDITDIPNILPVAYMDRNSLYNQAIVYANDDASIASRGPRTDNQRSNNFFALGTAAQTSAILQLHRELAAVTTYQITVSRRFILLEPLDLITLTYAPLGLSRMLCRITSIDDDANQNRTLTLEPVPQAASAPVYTPQANLGLGRNANQPASSVNAPIFYEPPDQLGQGLVLFIGLSGQVQSTFGGCEVWVSSDGDNYALIGSFEGSSRMGATTADLPAVTPVSNGATIDSVNPLDVDLTESSGALSNGSPIDLVNMNTLLVVGNELMAYQNATLTGANKYALSPLLRGAYDTTIADHPSGSTFLRLDGSYFEWGFTSDRVGQTLSFKFPSSNAFGGGQQSIADVPAYAYTVKGTALSSPLPNVSNVRTAYVDSVINLSWDEVSDFRPVRYEIRIGDSWATGLTLGTVAHPPFATPGDGTYWIAATSQPIAGLTVYSETPQSVTIAGSLLTTNIIASFNEASGGWTGTLTNAVIDGASIRTSSAGGSGTYEIPSAHVIDIGRSAPCPISITWKGAGVNVNQNILTMTDVLSNPDILDSGASEFVSVWPEIAIATALGSDVFAAADAFSPSDIFAGSTTFGPWQKFTPGTYVGRAFKARLVLQSNDPTIYAYATAFTVTIDVPDRVDTITNLALAAAGTAIVFTPNGASAPAPFNGGPNGSSVPHVSVTILNGQPSDQLVFLAGPTLSGVTLQILNGGVGVARNVNVDIQGY